MQNGTSRSCIRTNHSYWIRARFSSPTKSLPLCFIFNCSRSTSHLEPQQGKIISSVLECHQKKAGREESEIRNCWLQWDQNLTLDAYTILAPAPENFRVLVDHGMSYIWKLKELSYGLVGVLPRLVARLMPMLPLSKIWPGEEFTGVLGKLGPGSIFLEPFTGPKLFWPEA